VYEEQKKHSHSKTIGSKIKEIEFTARIENHDYETKLRHAEGFLSHGNKVKMRLKFRGREMAHTDIGFTVMKRAVADLAGMGHADADPKLIGRNIHVMLTPLPPNKRKPKFITQAEADEPEDDSDGHDATNDGTNGTPPAGA
jgi:translation initiation factor IF-3